MSDTPIADSLELGGDYVSLGEWMREFRKLERDLAAVTRERDALRGLDAAHNDEYRELRAEVERLKAALETSERHWVEDDRDLNELIEENERLRALLREALDIVRWADAVAPSGLSERIRAALGGE